MSKSENRFAECLTVRAVLRTFRNLQLIDADDQDDASARIRELTPPPTVSEEARERAQEVLDKGVRNLPISGRNVYLRGLLVRVIDALGYTPAPPEESPECPCPPGDCCVSQTASPPVVELDQTDLETLARLLASWSELALHLGVDVSHRLPIGYGDIRQREDDGAWVLRIGKRPLLDGVTECGLSQTIAGGTSPN